MEQHLAASLGNRLNVTLLLPTITVYQRTVISNRTNMASQNNYLQQYHITSKTFTIHSSFALYQTSLLRGYHSGFAFEKSLSSNPNRKIGYVDRERPWLSLAPQSTYHENALYFVTTTSLHSLCNLLLTFDAIQCEQMKASLNEVINK